LVVGTDSGKILIPREAQKNAGNTFVMIPAGNGKLIPVYIRPTFWNEIKDGKLKDRINRLLQEVVSPKYEDRYRALINLTHYLYLDKTGTNIVLCKGRAEVSLSKNGIIFKTFALDSTFNMQEFLKAVSDMNPRINVTSSILRQKVILSEYAEAGALMTDIAKLGTSGSSYSLYGLNDKGEMIIPAEGKP